MGQKQPMTVQLNPHTTNTKQNITAVDNKAENGTSIESSKNADNMPNTEAGKHYDINTEMQYGSMVKHQAH